MALLTFKDVVLEPRLSNSPNPGNPSQTVINLTQPGGASPLGAASLVCPEIFAMAVATVRGKPGENVEFWRFGFIQLKFITDEWVQYRGVPGDGSVFLAMDRPPARPQQLCRDTYTQGAIGPDGTFDLPMVPPLFPLFYDGDQPFNNLTRMVARHAGFLPAGTTIPANGRLPVSIYFADSPNRSYNLIENNEAFAPPRQNFLYSLYSGAAFATMFAAQKGVGRPIEVLKSFLWNVRWRAHFRRDAAGLIQQLPPKDSGEMRLTISKVVNGEPDDGRFPRSAIRDPRLPTCNDLLIRASTNPVRRTSRQFEDWEVRH